MQPKHYLAGLACSLVLINGCTSRNSEVWQKLPGSPEEPASVGLHSIKRNGDMVTMDVRILFNEQSPTNKKVAAAGKPPLTKVIAQYRYDCAAHTVELLKAVEHFRAVGDRFPPDPVETKFPPNAAPVKPDSSAEDAFNIACKNA